MIGAKDSLKGEVPLGFVVLKAGVDASHEPIEKECVRLVRDQIGPVAAFKTALVVNRLPKTRSGKILRGTMKKIADGDAWSMPATIDDPAILDEIAVVLKVGHHAGVMPRSKLSAGLSSLSESGQAAARLQSPLTTLARHRPSPPPAMRKFALVEPGWMV